MPFIMWNNLRTIQNKMENKNEETLCIICKTKVATWGGVSQPDKYWFSRQPHIYCWTCFMNRKL